MRIAVLLVALLMLAACNQNPAANRQPERSSITFLHYFTDSLSGGIADMAKVFNSQNSTFDLKPIPLDHESFKTSIKQNLETGNPPDLYSYWAGARTASVVEYLEPIDDVWAINKLDQRFTPTTVKAACEYNGKKYFIPLTQHYIGFFYNKRVFDTLNLKPPKTWKEFLVVCDRLKSGGKIPIALGAKEKWPAQFWFDLILLRTAPYEFREQLMKGEADYQDQKVSEVLRIWSNLVQKGYFNPKPNDLSWDSGANELVFSGKAGMTLMGTWVIGYFNDANHKWVAGRDYDFFPFPEINPAIPVVSIGPIDGIIVPKKSANKDGAKKALVFFTDAEPQKAMSQGSGAIAPSLTVPASYYGDIQQRVIKEITHSSHFAFAYDLSTPPAVAELGLNAFSEFLEFPTEYLSIQKRLASDASRQFKHTKR